MTTGMIPDAELIADCELFVALQVRMDGMVCRAAAGSAAERTWEAKLEPMWDRLDQLAGRISERKAMTPAGHEARVRALLSYPEVWPAEGIADANVSRIVMALLRDIAHDTTSYTRAAA